VQRGARGREEHLLLDLHVRLEIACQLRQERLADARAPLFDRLAELLEVAVLSFE
jgi:hypothetical protein